jgi:hypothetical protein
MKNAIVFTLSVATVVSATLFQARSEASTVQVSRAQSCEAFFLGVGASDLEIQRLAKLRFQGQRNWVQYDRLLKKRLNGKVSPLIQEQLNADAIGLIHRQFAAVFPNYTEYFHILSEGKIELKRYLLLRERARKHILTILRNPRATDNELFAALEITRVMSMIHSRVDFPSLSTQDDKQEQKKGKDNSKEPNPDQKEEDAKLNWSEMPDTYDPENKDVSNASNSKVKQLDQIKTTVFPIKKLMPNKVWDNITPDGQFASAPLNRPQAISKNLGPVIGHTILLLSDAKQFDLPVQYGVEPVPGEYNGFSIKEIYPQHFQIHISTSGLKEVSIPLREASALGFLGSQSEAFYKTHSNITNDQWPHELMDFIKALKAKNLPPLEVAAALEKHLSLDGGYLYYSKGNLIDEADFQKLRVRLSELRSKLPKAAAFAHLKSFNCDGAALIGTIILRDFFQITARPAGGFTVSGSKPVNGQTYFVSKTGSPLHAWVEVWNSNGWVPFDMTPKLNNPDSSSSSENDLDSIEEELPTPPPPSGNGSSQDGFSKPVDKKADPKKDTNLDRDKDGIKDKGKDKTKKEEPTTDASEEVENKLIDDLNLKQQSGRRPSKNVTTPDDALFHAVSAYLNQQLLIASDRRKVVEQADQWRTSSKDRESLREAVDSAQRKARSLFYGQLSQLPNGSLSGVMTAIYRKMLNGDMTGAYSNLRSLRMTMEQMREHGELKSAEQDFAVKIDRIIGMMRKHNHPDAKLYDVVQRLVNTLPGKISRQWLHNTYGSGFLTLGDPALHTLAKDILSGKLRPLILASLLRDYAKLVLNSEKIPNYKFEKTSNRASVMIVPKDVVIARSMNELPRMIFNPRPGEHILAPLSRGEQFSISERETVRVADPINPIRRKLSIVYYDVSGSMDGQNIEMVDALMLAFADIALSETDSFGKPTHEVIFIPFNTVPLLEHKRHIKTREDALEFIGNKSAFRTKTDGGTDIQAALVHFYETVAAAHRDSLTEKKLARILKLANLVLLSDGGSTVSESAVASARKLVLESINLYMNLIGVGNSNQALIDLAQSTAKMESQSMYRDLSRALMSEVAASAKYDLDPSAFASKEIVDPQLNAEFSELMRQIPSFELTPSEARIHELSQKLNFATNAADTLKNPGLVSKLAAMAFEIKNLNLPRVVRVDFMDRLLTNYAAISGRALDHLTYTEYTTLETLTKWALAIN